MRSARNNDIIRSTLSELILFLLFFFLILLGGVLNFLGTNQGEGLVGSKSLTPINMTGFEFHSGHSKLLPAGLIKFRTEIVPLLREMVADALERDDFEAIEIVGHTDGVHVSKCRIGKKEAKRRGLNLKLCAESMKTRRMSNLDEKLVLFMNSIGASQPLQHVDNVGLGMKRAAQIRRMILQDEYLKQFPVLIFSAADTNPEGVLVATAKTGVDDKRRRRMEIRVRGKLGSITLKED